MEPGHEIISDEALMSYGKSLEIAEFSKQEIIDFVKGIYKGNRRERYKIEAECVEEYTRLFNNCYTKNEVVSINEKNQTDSEPFELSDNIRESDNFDENRECVDHRHVIEDIDLKDKIKVMSEIVVNEEKEKIDMFFEEDIDDAEKMKIVYGIIYKIILNDIPVEAQQYYDLIDTQNNLSSAIIDVLRSNTNCRIMVGKSALEEVPCLD